MAKKRLTDNAASVLPPLYAAWMDELLGSSIPPETEATCDNCAMCAQPGEPLSDAAQFFNPQVKCCSYLPELPNFLVGRILSEAGGFRGDKDPVFAQGRASVEARLRAGVVMDVLPYFDGRSTDAARLIDLQGNVFNSEGVCLGPLNQVWAQGEEQMRQMWRRFGWF